MFWGGRKELGWLYSFPVDVLWVRRVASFQMGSRPNNG
jgi:hypothetical protein